MWAYYLIVSSFLNFISSVSVVFLVLNHNFRSSTNRAFSFFALSVSIWSFFYFLWQLSDVEVYAFLWAKMFMIGAVIIPATFFHFSIALINQERKYTIPALLFYIVSGFLVYATLTELLISHVRTISVFNYWPYPGKFFVFFLTFFSIVIIYAHFLIYSHYKSLSGVRRQQIIYVFLGTLIGFVGGASNYPLWFDFEFLPYGNVFVSVYVIMTAYAIIKYKFLNLQLAITKTGLLIFIFSLSFGFPMFLAFTTQEYFYGVLGKYWWVIPMSLISFFSITGFAFYLYLQRRAEERLLEEQWRYQATIRQASVGMGRVKNLKKLMELVVYVITRAARVDICAMYYAEDNDEDYRLKAYKISHHMKSLPRKIPLNSHLVQELKQTRSVVIRDYVVQKKQEETNEQLYVALLKEFNSLQAALVLPCFIEDRLVAVCVIGQKYSKNVFSDDDINVFTVLANQAALAIENAQFYDNMKRTHEQLYKAEKMATIGTLADGISHQINNRLHAMGFIAGDALDTLTLSRDKLSEKQAHELIEEMEYALGRIQDNVKKGGEIVEGLLKYTRKAEDSFGEVSLKELINSSYDIVKYKFKVPIYLQYDFDDQLPFIKGNFTQLQEVFLNLIDNAYDAMLERKEKFNEEGFQMVLRVTARCKNDYIVIDVVDNGIGVKSDDMKKLFTPFFTTKVTSKKGTGLGLYVIQKVVEENHHGRVYFQSAYKQGTTITLEVPVFKKG